MSSLLALICSIMLGSTTDGSVSTQYVLVEPCMFSVYLLGSQALCSGLW